MNTEIFREYDIRGDVERDLTDDVVRQYRPGVRLVHGVPGKKEGIDMP